MKTTQIAWIAAALALGALVFSGSAQARSDVTWSVGVGAPGLSIGATNAPPMYYAPPVYVQPQPVDVAPRPIFMGAPYYGPPPYGYGPRWERRGHHHYRRDARHWRGDRGHGHRRH
jgi:hypothetical protein